MLSRRSTCMKNAVVKMGPASGYSPRVPPSQLPDPLGVHKVGTDREEDDPAPTATLKARNPEAGPYP